MFKHIHKFWWALSAFSIALYIGVYVPIIRSDYVPVFWAQLPSIFLSALQYAAVGVVYAILARVAQRKAVFYLGAIQLFAQTLVVFSGSALAFSRNQVLLNSAELDRSELFFPSIVMGFASMFAALAFFAAMMAALGEMRGRINEAVF